MRGICSIMEKYIFCTFSLSSRQGPVTNRKKTVEIGRATNFSLISLKVTIPSIATKFNIINKPGTVENVKENNEN